MSYGKEFVLTLFTDDPILAGKADQAGINRIGVDLDWTGKHERQNSSAWITTHKISDLPKIRESLRQAKLFVRVDNPQGGTREQVDRVIGMGAQVIMLPMFTRVEEAAQFIDWVGGRVQVSLLVETAAAAARIQELVRLRGVDEIFIGLNDLHLSLGLRSHFEVLASPLMEMFSETVRASGIPFGFGGLGRVGDAKLPIPSELIYPQYPRLGATSALVSRVYFSTQDPVEFDLKQEIARTREELNQWSGASFQTLNQSRDALAAKVRERFRQNA